MIEDRLKQLRQDMLNTVPEICIERAEIVTRCYHEMEELPAILKRAHSLNAILREMTIYIDDGELIVGNQASIRRAAPLYPEYSVQFVLDEMDSFELRESDRFDIAEEKKNRLRNILPWWSGKTLRDRALATQSEKVLEDRKIGVLGWQGNIASGEGHYIPDYDMVMKLGLRGLLDRVIRYMDELDLTQPADLEKLTFYRACKVVLEGCLNYIARFAELAKVKAKETSDSMRFKELNAIAENCTGLLDHEPQSFYQALQCLWFVQVILHVESNGHSISMGRADQYLYPFMKKDINDGLITEEQVHELIGCFFIKVFGNNKLRSASTTRTQLGYPTYQNICLGGQTFDGKDATNQLTDIFLDMLAEIRLPEPNVYVRLYPGTTEEFLQKAVKVVKLGFGIPAFVNDQVIIPSLMRFGVTKEDAYNYSTIGCTEVQVPGKWSYRPNGKSKINLLKILQISIDGGVDIKSGITVLDGLRPMEDCADIKEIMDNYRKLLEYYTDLHVIADNINEMAMNDLVPDAFCSLLMQDCLGRGKAIKEGGVVYDIISGTLVGIANVGNALYAIKRVVFDKGLISFEELREALDSDFQCEKGEVIRQLLLNSAEKFGNDCDAVDNFVKVTSDYFVRRIPQYKTMLEGKGPIGCCYTSSTVTITANISCGAVVGATPDGRKAGEPTADGISPSRGTIKNGPTAVLKSVGKLSTELFSGGQLLNMRIDPKTIESPEEEKKLGSLLKGFGDLKCWHVQFNMVSNETLRDAQKHPENYSDLIVRVAGYSALYTSLSHELQDDIMARTEFTL